MPKSIESKDHWVKVPLSGKEDYEYYLPEENPEIIAERANPSILNPGCPKICTKLVTLVPKTLLEPHFGIGYFPFNVDGFRYVNVYTIGDPLFSFSERGFSLQISFAPRPFVLGVGVYGETSHFFDFETYYNTVDLSKKIVPIRTSDQTVFDGLPYIGGTHLTHLTRIPIMGPYIRASVFNEDPDSARAVEVIGYFTT